MFELTISRKNADDVSGTLPEDSDAVRYCGILKEGYGIAYDRSNKKRIVISHETDSVVAEAPELCAHLFEESDQAEQFLDENDLKRCFEVQPVFFKGLEKYNPDDEPETTEPDVEPRVIHCRCHSDELPS